ncbi:MAG: acyltransferase [Phycisphaerae bacterium]
MSGGLGGISRPSLDGDGAASLKPGRKWLAYGDAMRVLGVMAVIVVHVNDMVLFSNSVGQAHWWFANFVDASGRWAVPVFIMLSGALLLNPSRDESPKEFYRRRLARLGVATVFWSIFFMLFAVYYTGWCVGAWNVPPGDWHKSVWRELLRGAPYMHLHFVFRLAGLYLITPLLRLYVRHASLGLRTGMMLAIFGMAMAGSVATSILGTAPDGQPIDSVSGFAILWPFLGFYLAGDVLREVTVTRRLAAWSFAGYLLCVAAMAVGTGVAVGPLAGTPAKPQVYPSLDMMMYDFLNPTRVLMSFCAWFIFAYIFGRMSLDAPIQRIFKYLAPLTLGIYLVHPLFREILFVKAEWLWDLPNVWYGVPLIILLVVVASTALTWVLSRIPVVRKIIG